MSQSEASERLRKESRKWIIIVLLVIATVLALYFGRFWYLGGYRLPTTGEGFGAFGDFFGGILNPLISLAAFYWLTKSIRLQMEELQDTRTELLQTKEATKEAAMAQREAVSLEILKIKLAENGSYLEHLEKERDKFLRENNGSLVGVDPSKDYKKLNGELIKRVYKQDFITNLTVSIRQTEQDRVALIQALEHLHTP